MAEPDRRVYHLLQRAAHGLRTAADRRCTEAAGVTVAQLTALHVITEEPGCTQQRVAEVLGVREPAITAMIARLSAAGLVDRRAHPDQHRASALHPTPAGEAAVAAGRPTMEEFNAAIREALGGRLDEVAEAVRDLLELSARL
jgi:DNA-binding MarR family transcriptional regulator